MFSLRIILALNDSYNQRATKLARQAANVLPVCVNRLVYARHGRDLMGCKSPVYESRYYQTIVAKILAEGKGDLVRDGLKEAGVQICGPTDRNVIQGQVSG